MTTKFELARERIRKFCAEWKMFKSNDQTTIYALNPGSPREAVLFMDDLEIVSRQEPQDVDSYGIHSSIDMELEDCGIYPTIENSRIVAQVLRILRAREMLK